MDPYWGFEFGSFLNTINGGSTLAVMLVLWGIVFMFLPTPKDSDDPEDF